MSKKKNSKNLVPCHGCGRHAREVDSKVVVWFCEHCFLENGNYNRYNAGMEMIKPLTDIKVKDILLGADNKQYQVIGKGEWFKEDKFFPVKSLDTKKEYVMGDFFFVKKVSK